MGLSKELSLPIINKMTASIPPLPPLLDQAKIDLDSSDNERV
jgi:hypothetical protein